MPYTATIISSAINGANREVTIDYTNGVNTLRDTIRASAPTLAWFQSAVRERIAQLDQAAAFVPPTGPYIPPPADTPSPFESARQAWRANLNRLRVALIVFDPTHAIIVNLKATLVADYQNGFLD